MEVTSIVQCAEHVWDRAVEVFRFERRKLDSAEDGIVVRQEGRVDLDGPDAEAGVVQVECAPVFQEVDAMTILVVARPAPEAVALFMCSPGGSDSVGSVPPPG
jgi:hypothetical protein